MSAGPYETGTWKTDNNRDADSVMSVESLQTPGAVTLPPLKSIMQLDNFSPARPSLPSIHIPAGDDHIKASNTGGYRLIPNPYTVQSHTRETITQTRAELKSEIDRLRSLLNHKAGILENLEQAERANHNHGPSADTMVRLPSIKEGFDALNQNRKEHIPVENVERLDDAEVRATQALMSLASGGVFV